MTSDRTRTLVAGILIGAFWVRSVLPSVITSYTTTKTQRRDAQQASASAVSISHLLLLMTLAIALAIIVLCLPGARLRQPLTLAALLLPCFYLYFRDGYSGFSSGMTNTLFFPAAAIAIWLLRPPLDSLRILGYLIGILAVGSLAMGVLTPTAGLLQGDGTEATLDKQIFSSGVLVGPFENGNVLGHLLSIGAPAILLIRRRMTRRILMAATVLAVLWAASRNSLITLAVLLLVVVMVRRVPSTLRVFVSCSLGVLMLVVGVVLPLVSTDPTSFTNRVLIWQNSFDSWQDNPVFGLGSNWYDAQLGSATRIASSATQGHNEFVHVLTTGGMVLVVLVGILCVTMLAQAARRAASGVFFPIEYVVPFFTAFWFELSLSFISQDYAYPVTVVPIAFALFAPAGSAPVASSSSSPEPELVAS